MAAITPTEPGLAKTDAVVTGIVKDAIIVDDHRAIDVSIPLRVEDECW